MKITDVQPYAIRMPFKKGQTPMPARNYLTAALVKVMTDEGIVGIGEPFGHARDCAPLTKRAVEWIKPMLIGKDPLQIESRYEELYRATYTYGRMGVMMNAISGVEMALWDIAGKAANMPVYQMLGGRSQEKIRAYASLIHYVKKEELAEACKRYLAQGYTAIKLHETTAEAVGTARKALGDDVDLMVDVNCAWDTFGAIKMGKAFKEYNLYWYEEPVWPVDDYEGMKKLRVEAGIPLAAGENEYTARGFTPLIVNRVVDVVQPSIPKVGGILQGKKVFTLARNFGVRVTPHSPFAGPALAATLHLCFSEPYCEPIETRVLSLEANLMTKVFAPEKGFWNVPDGPGLGIELNEDVLTRYSMA